MTLESLARPWSTPEDRSPFLRATLWLVARCGWILRRFGIDEQILHELLRARVLISMREGAKTGHAGMWVGAALGVLMSTFAGLLTGLVAVMTDDPKHWIVVSLSFLFLMQGMVQLTQLAGILVDPTDVRVIAPHPVPDRTLLAARIVQLLALTLLLSAGFTAGNMTLAVFKQPPLTVLLLYPILSVLCSLVAVGAIALCFALLLRVFGPAQFQRLTLWVQILGGALVFCVFQLFPRIVPPDRWDALVPENHPVLYLWPPYQYAAVFQLGTGAWTRTAALAGAAAFLTPVLALLATFALASRYFTAGLEGTLATGARARSAWPSGVVRRLVGKLPLPREQRVAFDYTLALTRREPHFLRGVLPQLVSFQIMAIAMLVATPGRQDDLFIPMAAGLLGLALPNMLEFAQGTPVPEARWIFLAAPLESEAALVRGGVKALFLGWWGPAALVLMVVQTSLIGPARLPQILLAQELSLCLGLVLARRFRLGVPFTQALRVGASSVANLGMILMMGFGLVALGAVHALLCLSAWTLWGGIAGMAVADALAWRALDSQPVAKSRRLD